MKTTPRVPSSLLVSGARRLGACALAFAAIAAPLHALGAPDALREGFANPPSSARPMTYWYWMDGNITREGLALDMDWMKRVGIAGVIQFDVTLPIPQVVEKRLVYMQPDWQDAFRGVVRRANDLDLELTIGGAPGWSETGGPWVTPAQAMKKLVWSAAAVTGGQPYSGTLPKPPGTTGPFQDSLSPRDPSATSDPPAQLEYYADSVVLAYPAHVADMQPGQVTTSDGPIANAGVLYDGRLASSLVLKAGADKSAWIRYAYALPQTVRAITLAMPWLGRFLSADSATARLEASDDGTTYRFVAQFNHGRFAQQTLAVTPTTARYFRLTLSPAAGASSADIMILKNASPGAIAPAMGPAAPAGDFSYTINDLVLHEAGRVNQFEAKAGFTSVPDYYAIDGAPGADTIAVQASEVIDLTDRMDAQGVLHWTPPPGRWTVLRLGYTLTGATNAPAPAEATGLEVDKLNREHVRSYMQQYLKTYTGMVGTDQVGHRGVRSFETDSVEAGFQNWTEQVVKDFRRLRGYDPTPWLPALTGEVIGSVPASDRFLWDFRRTLAQLLAENHYGQVAESAHAQGLTYYSEALENHRPTIGDDMEMRSHADVPMGALWAFRPENGPDPSYIADLRGAASVAHLYGRKVAAAESLTSAMDVWDHSPRDLRQMIDLEFAHGINRAVLHVQVHQPLVDRKPGLALWFFGQCFTRNETWAEQAAPWVSYISRNSQMLQQGRFFADVAYFYGEEAPLTSLNENSQLDDTPVGYAYDFVNATALLGLFTVDKGELAVPSGMRYRAIQLGGSSRRMTLPVLRRLRDLVSAGAVVVGSRPTGTPSLADDDAEFARIAEQLWPSAAPGPRTVRLGKGRVISGMGIEEALASLGVPADFTYTKPHADTSLLFVHRRLADGDMYFVVNHGDRAENTDVTLRVAGKEAELWHADTGLAEQAAYAIHGNRTTVPLALAPHESVYVVLRRPAAGAKHVQPTTTATTLATVAGPWQVSFDPAWGGPAEATFPQLDSWSSNGDAGIRYYSGTATYTTTVTADADWFKGGKRLALDLGEVRELAEVTVNGKSLGIVWHPPYTIDVSHDLRPGANTLEVKVTNLWVNRLIGDLQPGVARKYTYTSSPAYAADAPLRQSGLLGPVRLLATAPLHVAAGRRPGTTP